MDTILFQKEGKASPPTYTESFSVNKKPEAREKPDADPYGICLPVKDGAAADKEYLRTAPGGPHHRDCPANR